MTRAWPGTVRTPAATHSNLVRSTAGKPGKEFPIIQKPNTFTIDDAVKMMHDTAIGSG